MKKYLHNEFDMAEYPDAADELPLWSAPFGLKLLEHIIYKPGISALDIGFGTGFPMTEIALRLGEESTVYGIDPWKEATIRAKKKIAYYGISNIRILEGRAESIPLEDSTIDLIVSNNGINNVNNIEQVFSECSRVIRKGGQFVQTMNSDRTMFEFYDELEQVLIENKMEHEVGLMRKQIHQKRRPLDEITEMVRKNGFLIRDLEHDRFDYRFATGTALLNHYFIRLAFMGPWIRILPEGKGEEILGSIESRLNERSKVSGGIKLSVPFVVVNSFKE